jgi:hypothetical protein
LTYPTRKPTRCASYLRTTIDGDRFPLSPRLRPYKAILAKIDPPKSPAIAAPKATGRAEPIPHPQETAVGRRL